MKSYSKPYVHPYHTYYHIVNSLLNILFLFYDERFHANRMNGPLLICLRGSQTIYVPMGPFFANLILKFIAKLHCVI